MNYAGHHVISATTPVVTSSPLAVGFLWTDTSGTPALKICTSVSPVTFATVGSGTVTDANVIFSDITTGNATTSQHGFLPKLSGNVYDSLRGDGTWQYGIARGTIATSTPQVFSQAWHGAGTGTVFKGYEIRVTQDTGFYDPNNSRLFQVFGGTAGNDEIFRVDSNVGVTSQGQLIALTYLKFGDTASIYTGSRGELHTPADGVWRLGRGSQGQSVELMAFAVTVTAGFGTSPAIVGNETAGRITVGAAPGTTGTITFGKTWTNIPICIVQNETTGVFGIAAPTTTKVDVSSLVMVAGDKIVYHCFGF